MNRILVATLADGVQAMPGQKFSVLGGGFDNLNATVFPAVFPRISLLLALEIEAGTDVPMACQVTLRRWQRWPKLSRTTRPSRHS